MNTETVKGFKDITGEKAVKKQEIKNILENIFELYGFEPAETPVIEYEEFVKSDNERDEAVSDIFKLQDKGKRKLALRYEFTFQLKRISKNQKLPYKRYQIGPVFRDEPVSSNRFRQFTQCDIDTVGSSIKDQSEILSLVDFIFKKLDIKIKINIGNRKLLDEILEKNNILKNKEQILRELDKLDKLPEKQVISNLKKYNAEQLLTILKKPESYFKKFQSYNEILELKKYCNYYNLKLNFQPSLVRGLSYYTGNVFEVKSEELKETICAGGAYKVNNLNSVGISFGLERIEKICKLKNQKQKILVISLNQDKESIKISEKLRQNNINCQIYFNKLLKALEYANSKSFSKVIIVGEKDLKNKKITIKDLSSGKNFKVNLKDIIKKLI